MEPKWRSSGLVTPWFATHSQYPFYPVMSIVQILPNMYISDSAHRIKFEWLGGEDAKENQTKLRYFDRLGALIKLTVYHFEYIPNNARNHNFKSQWQCNRPLDVICKIKFFDYIGMEGSEIIGRPRDLNIYWEIESDYNDYYEIKEFPIYDPKRTSHPFQNDKIEHTPSSFHSVTENISKRNGRMENISKSNRNMENIPESNKEVIPSSSSPSNRVTFTAEDEKEIEAVEEATQSYNTTVSDKQSEFQTYNIFDPRFSSMIDSTDEDSTSSSDVEEIIKIMQEFDSPQRNSTINAQNLVTETNATSNTETNTESNTESNDQHNIESNDKPSTESNAKSNSERTLSQQTNTSTPQLTQEGNVHMFAIYDSLDDLEIQHSKEMNLVQPRNEKEFHHQQSLPSLPSQREKLNFNTSNINSSNEERTVDLFDTPLSSSLEKKDNKLSRKLSIENYLKQEDLETMSASVRKRKRIWPSNSSANQELEITSNHLHSSISNGVMDTRQKKRWKMDTEIQQGSILGIKQERDYTIPSTSQIRSFTCKPNQPQYSILDINTFHHPSHIGHVYKLREVVKSSSSSNLHTNLNSNVNIPIQLTKNPSVTQNLHQNNQLYKKSTHPILEDGNNSNGPSSHDSNRPKHPIQRSFTPSNKKSSSEWMNNEWKAYYKHLLGQNSGLKQAL